MFTVQRQGLNLFVPSFLACAQVIYNMNNMMMTTHRFIQGAADWSPFLSLAFFGNCFIIQCLRAMREVRPLAQHEDWLLSGIESVISLDSLMIPGPIIPFFQALAACSSPREWFGNIAPNVTDLLADFHQDGNYLLANNMSRIMPNIPFYIDCLEVFRGLAPDLQGNQLTQAYRMFYQDILQGVADPTNATAEHMRAPGLPVLPHSMTLHSQAVTAALNLDLPARLNITGNSNSLFNLSQFMRLYDDPDSANLQYHTWFDRAAGIHARYAQFFKDSVPLSAITPTGIGASIPRIVYQAGNNRLIQPFQHVAAVPANPPAPAVPAFFRRLEVNALNAQSQHFDDELEEVAEQCAQLAQVNISFTGSGMNDPTDANLRSGDVWALTRIRQSGSFDIAPGIYARLASSYHMDARLN